MIQTAKNQTKKLKAKIDLLKEGRACADCKKDWPPYVMSFDLDDKDLMITQDTIFKDGAVKQLEGVDLLCANCMRIRSHKRNNSD